MMRFGLANYSAFTLFHFFRSRTARTTAMMDRSIQIACSMIHHHMPGMVAWRGDA